VPTTRVTGNAAIPVDNQDMVANGIKIIEIPPQSAVSGRGLSGVDIGLGTRKPRLQPAVR